MRKHFLWTTTTALVYVVLVLPAMAGLPPTRSGGQSGSLSTTFDFLFPFNQAIKTTGTRVLVDTGNFNLIGNPGFEAATYDSGWLITSVFAKATGSNVGSGSAALDWNASTLGNDVIYQVAVPNAWRSQNGIAWCHIKAASGTHTIRVHVTNTSADDLGGSAVVESSTTVWKKNAVWFTFPTSGDVQLRLIAYANEPQVYIDDCYLGLLPASDEAAENSPRFSVFFNSTFNDGGSGTWTEASMNSVNISANRNVLFSSNRVTPLQAGAYFVYFEAWKYDSTDTAVLGCRIARNGATFSEQFAWESQTGSKDSGVNCAALVDVDGIDDYIHAYVYQDTGATRTWEGTRTVLTGWRIK